MLFLILTCISLCFATEPPTVETTIGSITGEVKDVNVFGETREVVHFHGIPYAEPPVGDLRFRNAVPKRPLESPLLATSHGKACFQMNILPLEKLERSEDCLFLNVYAPANNTGGLAVMVYIHGGAFVHGASDPYVSDTLSVFGNVVVVTFNYRLSILGFLSTGDKHAPGNYALSDQQMAIRWVHDNIEAFGGDPNKVTLFGQSAGGVSVVIQSLYEENAGLFQRAIAQSGTLVPRPLDFKFSTPVEDTKNLGKLVGCKSRYSADLVACLRTKPAEILYATLHNVSNGFFKSPLPFIINALGGEILDQKPNDLLKDTSRKYASQRAVFSSLDFLFGFNANDGCFNMGPHVGVPKEETFLPNRTVLETQLVPLILSMTFASRVPKLIDELVLQVYTDWADPENEVKIREDFIALSTDILFAETVIEASIHHDSLAADVAKTFLYEFDVLPSAHPIPSPSWCDRASHGDELFYLFFEDSGGIMTFVPGFEDFEPEAFERNIAQDVMRFWTNFAKTGYILHY